MSVDFHQTLILWRSGSELLLGKFCPILTEFSARDTSKFSYPENNLSKCQWIFTKLSMCIDIIKTWFGITNGQILSIFDRVNCLRHVHNFVSR